MTSCNSGGRNHCANRPKDPQCKHFVLACLPINLICVAPVTERRQFSDGNAVKSKKLILFIDEVVSTRRVIKKRKRNMHVKKEKEEEEEEEEKKKKEEEKEEEEKEEKEDVYKIIK